MGGGHRYSMVFGRKAAHMKGFRFQCFSKCDGGGMATRKRNVRQRAES